jgi:hypothetical protein
MTAQAKFLLIASAIAIAFIALDRVALWMERRGWIHWRKKKPEGGGGGAMAGMLTGFQKIVEPQIEHRIQVMEERNESIGQRLGRGDGIDPPPTTTTPASPNARPDAPPPTPPDAAPDARREI